MMNTFETTSRSLWDRPLIWFGLAIDLIMVDQLTKWLIRTYLEAPVVLIPEWLEFVFVENHGIAFSLPVPGGVSSLVAVLVTLYLGWQIATRKLSNTVKMGYALIIGGAVGNLIDRVWHGAVTDFISVSSFPVFNMADAFICVGVALIIWREVTSG